MSFKSLYKLFVMNNINSFNDLYNQRFNSSATEVFDLFIKEYQCFFHYDKDVMNKLASIRSINYELEKIMSKLPELTLKQYLRKVLIDEVEYTNKIEALQKEIDILKADNLKYKQKIQSSTQAIQAKEDNIADLETKLNETVTAARSIQTASSNRDAELSHLRSELESAHKIIAEYQDAYANLYASAVGVSLNNVAVTGSTSVSQLKQMIKSTTAIEETAMQEISSLGDTDDGLVTL